jgi:bifunctional enzyme CysN/CysC
MSVVSQIKVITCGSVDDGKSTLVGRILSETDNILTDQEAKLKVISKRYGTTKDPIDYALLMDGLQDEREQGITIDVAYKYINYKNKRLVFCDSPGHSQYTKNVVTAASNCNIGIILIDAAKGVLEQTKRHVAILDFAGISSVIFAINKIDTVQYNQSKYLQIKKNIEQIVKSYSFKTKFIIPISALKNENIIKKTSKLHWYKGKNLLDQLISIKVLENKMKESYLPIQHVHRPNRTIRHYMGTAIGQNLKKGKIVYVLPSQQKTKIKNIFYNNKKQKITSHNYPASIETSTEIDIVRGDIIVSNINSVDIGNCFNASVVVTSNDNVIAGRQYLARIHNKETKITITKIKKKLDINSGKTADSKELLINDIGEIEFETNEKIAFANFNHSKQLGSFVIIDLENNNVVSAGKINFALRRSGNIFQNQFEINKIIRAKFLKQVPKCIWFTGISGSGKTTVASALEKSLFNQNKLTYFLDADNLRAGINKDLGFAEQDRVENIRRISEIAKLMVDAGLIVIVAAISPYSRERQFAKSLFDKKEFFEVFVNTPLKVCIKRDPKGLYKKSKKDKNMNKTGLGANYEKPKKPDLEIDTSKQKTDAIVKDILKKAFN